MEDSILELTVDIEIKYIHINTQSIVFEQTIADRIMPSGARILAPREIPVGATMLVRTADQHFQSKAEVKACEHSTDYIWYITVEFIGNHSRRDWVYPQDPKDQVTDELLDASKQAYLLLQNLQMELQSGTIVEKDLMDDVRKKIDHLRKIVFQAQRIYNK